MAQKNRVHQKSVNPGPSPATDIRAPTAEPGAQSGSLESVQRALGNQAIQTLSRSPDHRSDLVGILHSGLGNQAIQRLLGQPSKSRPNPAISGSAPIVEPPPALPTIQRTHDQLTIQRTREEALKAIQDIYSYNGEDLLKKIKNTNLNDRYRLGLVRINNQGLEPSHKDYIVADPVDFPDLAKDMDDFRRLAGQGPKGSVTTTLSAPVQQPQPSVVASQNPSSALNPKQNVEGSESNATPKITRETDPPTSPGDRNIKEYKRSDFEVIKVFESGSTKPQLIKFKDGTKKVLKFGNEKHPEHVLTEILAQKLYKAANIPTLEAETVRVDGKLAQLTDYVEKFTEPNIEDLRSSPDFYRHVGADMVFANWDLFKTGNWMEINGRMVRADLGGSLDRRAQGDVKKEFFNPDVAELATMREKDASKNPYKLLTDQEIADSIRTLLFHLTPEKIDEAMREANYPTGQQAQVKEAILRRLESARKWADKVYPLAETHASVFQTSKPQTSNVSSTGPLDPLSELEQLGYTISPIMKLFSDDFGVLRTMFEENLHLELNLNASSSAELITPPAYVKGVDPRETPPMVGPEELMREDQYGGGLRQKVATGLSRLRTGVLMRRMSDGEKAGFIKATTAKDLNEVVTLLFDVGKRGEIVFSVNEPFIFERERKRLTGQALTAEELRTEKEDSEKYKWIMEMPISDDMLKFLDDFAYISNPSGGAKPEAFIGNPNVKFEGEAGGSRNAKGLPNVVLKNQGFEKFWGSVRQLRFVLAEQHLWKYRSSNADLVKAKLETERKQKTLASEQEKYKNKQARETAEREEEQLGFGLGSLDKDF